MLPVKALDFVMNSQVFINKMNQKQINPDFCLEIKMRLLPNAEERYYYYDMYFDYGLPGKSIKDVLVKVKVLPQEHFEILQINFL
ncbi:hypothetical protein [Chryseobacterium sp.]|uniref:hypothetical protein n=1 Tax=Chryseobacterium sp. TaxID=1871047 RepID=UPI002FC89B2B